MKNSVSKMEALISMKNTFINVLKEATRKANGRIMRLEDRLKTAEDQITHLKTCVHELELESSWWKAQDQELERQTIEVPFDKETEYADGYAPTKTYTKDES